MNQEIRHQLEKQTKKDLIELIETISTMNIELMQKRIEEQARTSDLKRAFWFMTVIAAIGATCVYYLTHH